MKIHLLDEKSSIWWKLTILIKNTSGNKDILRYRQNSIPSVLIWNQLVMGGDLIWSRAILFSSQTVYCQTHSKPQPRLGSELALIQTYPTDHQSIQPDKYEGASCSAQWLTLKTFWNLNLIVVRSFLAQATHGQVWRSLNSIKTRKQKLITQWVNF